jgi:hypothetical protein
MDMWKDLRTHHFDHPAYHACVAGAAICIVRIVTPRKRPNANATFVPPPPQRNRLEVWSWHEAWDFAPGGSPLVSEG